MQEYYTRGFPYLEVVLAQQNLQTLQAFLTMIQYNFRAKVRFSFATLRKTLLTHAHRVVRHCGKPALHSSSFVHHSHVLGTLLGLRSVFVLNLATIVSRPSQATMRTWILTPLNCKSGSSGVFIPSTGRFSSFNCGRNKRILQSQDGIHYEKETIWGP